MHFLHGRPHSPRNISKCYSTNTRHTLLSNSEYIISFIYNYVTITQSKTTKMSTLISCELEADSFTIIAMAAFHIKNQQHTKYMPQSGSN